MRKLKNIWKYKNEYFLLHLEKYAIFRCWFYVHCEMFFRFYGHETISNFFRKKREKLFNWYKENGALSKTFKNRNS